MDSEFQKGYKKCVEDFKKKLGDLKDYSKESLNELVKEITGEEKKRVKPTIYFTRLNKKGELEPDWEKTYYYADHPEELGQSQPKVKKGKEVKLVLTKDPKRIAKIKKQMGIDKKTEEMMKAENALIFGGIDFPLEGQTSDYWNMLGQQIITLSQNERNATTMFIVAGVDPNEEGAMENLLKKAGEEGFAFDFVED